ncbi:MAG: hypothetical protein M3302_02185 [Actinomycetota bacterium]|nr:hypothetical protein [Actinomycetota bacterium]
MWTLAHGTPLVLSPDTDTLNPPIPPDALNDFDYEDDERGYGARSDRISDGCIHAGNASLAMAVICTALFGAASPTVRP